ncbi:sarcosine oxidase subunit gamma [Leekyejoonella antrihumi]|uniref:Sarcosine oxidase subunit gamma n=1 Tax=Leekyejoonella antrihumi TaxID=1660198 RepID=A0A563E975_9MICO|nr:sarcosine oxidase subunit gamma [Leekyejoonella antrihumi]
MAVDQRVSPLELWRAEFKALPAGVRLRELAFLTQLSLRLVPESPAVAAVSEALGVALPLEPCSSAVAGEVTVLWLGPDEWLVMTPTGDGETERNLRAAVQGHGAVIDVSGQRTTVSVSGPRARDLLAHGCSIDLHPRVNHAGSCVQTHLAKAGVAIWTRDDSGTDFWVVVRTSFADYLARWLVDACVPHRQDPQWQ